MDLTLLAQADPTTHTPVAEAVAFWILAPVALGSAIAMVLSRNAVHAALLLVLDFFCLAVFYAAQGAPFLAAVQVIVYAGAIMVLFLFVLMLIGFDANESLRETLRGQRIAAIVVGLGLGGVLVGGIGHALLKTPSVGVEEANSGGNVLAIARLLYGAADRGADSYLLAFEMTSALLIVAALGAMVLAHKQRAKLPSQREQSIARFAGTHPTPLPGPGVFHGTDDTTHAALLPDGSPAPGSAVPRVEHWGGDA
ncbi:MAG TPA: NADH-quinone oxidoreductase subunit J [Mycobacteriales bacterium]|jgi:NADH-quinone oxidoreductase subunit J|nr:NADH-quinone oxidoreductase subunit J [Mycobacteriales bacterium]